MVLQKGLPGIALVVIGPPVQLSILTSLNEGLHGKPEMVHLNTLRPFPNPVIAVEEFKGDTIVPLPEINDHVPTPYTAGVAVKVAEVLQIV